MRYSLALVAAVLMLAGCTDRHQGPLEGRPGGPYRLTLTLDPPAPKPGQETVLHWQLTHTQSGKPVRDLQVAHERLMHNFIVNLDFSSFAHIHHEDFQVVTAHDLAQASLKFPYRFPAPGHYRIVSEFAHHNRSWTKHFDIDIGADATSLRSAPKLSRTSQVAAYQATLQVSPKIPIAGFETELELTLQRGGVPVTDLALYLGTELHGAVWRDDGRYFGHLHSYTPRVAAIIHTAHDRDADPRSRGATIAQMMVQLMCLESELVFTGPTIPMRYVFPEPGRYHLFLQAAPGGDPLVFQFALDVVAVTNETVANSATFTPPIPRNPS